MTSSPPSILSRPRADRWLALVTRSCAGASAALLLLVFVFLTSESAPALARIGVGRFLTDHSWHPLSNEFSLVPMVAATILTTVGAILLAGPLGIASAVFSCFYAPDSVSVVASGSAAE